MGIHKHTDKCKQRSLRCAIEVNHKHDHRCRGVLPGERKESRLCWKEEGHQHDPEKCYIKVINCRIKDK